MNTSASKKTIATKVLFALLVLGNLFCYRVQAQTGTPQFSSVLGTGGNAFPLSITAASPHTQFVYAAGEFVGATAGMITAIYMQPTTAVTSVSYTNFTVRMVQQPAAFTVFASGTYLTGLQTCLGPANKTYTGVALNGWLKVDLTTPFYYNPALALVIDIQHQTPGTGSAFSGKGGNGTGGNKRIYGAYGATSGTAGSSYYNMGIDISSLSGNDAGVFSIDSPASYCSSGTLPVKATIKNYGRNRILSVDVNWSVDGVAQSPYSFTGILDTTGGSLSSSAQVTLGSYAFSSAPVNIKAWTSGPNSVTDTVPLNDSAEVTKRSSLSGTYTIGGTTPDYPTFTAAVNDLNTYGICGPVTFQVAPGTFTERITINQVAGSSATNTIRFEGSGKTSTTITYAATGTADLATILLNGADHITLRDMTIGGSNVTYGVGVLLTGSANNNVLKNLKIQMNATSTAATTAGVALSGATTGVSTAGNNGDNNTFDSLEVDGAYYGITMYGTSSTVYNSGNRITNCVLTNTYYYGLRDYYQNGIVIQNNRIGPFRNTTNYGIYNYYSANYTLDGNNIQASYTGLYNYYSNQNNYNAALKTTISNNMIAAGSTYGIYFTNSSNVRIVHNTIQVMGTSGAMYFVSGTGYHFRNNIVASINSGANSVMYIAAGVLFDSLDYNNYYSSGTGFITGGAVYATLAAWKTAQPTYNANSLSINPQFVSASDLHLQLTSPAMPGINLGILTDIDGQVRINPPTMGSDERNRISDNAGITRLVSPVGFCPGTRDIKVNIINNGNNIINNVLVNWELDGTLQTPIAWISPLDTLGGSGNNDTTITLGSVTFASGITRTVKAWTSAPNYMVDSFNYDDTIFVSLKPSLSGNYSIGATGDYPTITAAMADMQQGVCGPVLLELQSNYTASAETYPLVINPVGTNDSNFLTIRPAIGVTGLNITSANVVTTIDLNRAKYVNIDGRPGGVGNQELTITNTSSTGAALRLINDAQYNKLSNLIFVASNSSTTSGVIQFSTAGGTGATSGNNYNLIDSCQVNGNSASVNGIYSLGSPAPADNKSNTITNCNVFDFFSNVASTDVSGVVLWAGNSLWNIGTPGNGNKFYQTAARTPSTTPALNAAVFFKAVYINDVSVGGCNVVGNRIGGNIPGISGSTFVFGNATANYGHTLRVIDNYASSPALPTSIQGNTISDITFYSTITNAFIGIHGRNGSANTGNITGNTIGSTTGNGSIQLFHMSTTTGANSYAIRYEACPGLVQNNQIGSITAEVQNASGTMQLLCIYAAGSYSAPLTISNNFIGSNTTPHSVQSSSASIGGINVMGIVASSATVSPITFSNNTVINISSLCPVASTSNGLKGIYVTGTSAGGSTVSGNTIRNLYSVSTNPGADQTAAVVGVSNTTSSGFHIISGNTIRNLMSNLASSTAIHQLGIYFGSTSTSAGSRIESNLIHWMSSGSTNLQAYQKGIAIGAGTTRVAVGNNMIALGYDSSGSTFTGPNPIIGIFKNGGLASFFHNTVRIGGTGVGTYPANTYGLYSSSAAADSVFNNVFVNARANASTGGTHFAIGLTSTLVAINYNLYYTPSAPLGEFNSIGQASLSAWRTATFQDSNSASANMFFVSNNDLHLIGSSVGNLILTGMPLAAWNTDFDAQVRSPYTPYMGADEIPTSPLPVKLISLNAVPDGNHVKVSWTSAMERNASHYLLEVSASGNDFIALGNVAAKGNSNALLHYQFQHENARLQYPQTPVIYYRLIAMDKDGRQEIFGPISVQFEEKESKPTLFPNPFGKEITFSLNAQQQGVAIIQILDITGKLIATQQKSIHEGMNQFNLDCTNELGSGIYFIRTDFEGWQDVQKMVRE